MAIITNMNRPRVEIISPEGIKDPSGSFSSPPTIIQADDRTYTPTILFDFEDKDIQTLSGAQAQIIVDDEIIWDSKEVRMESTFFHRSGLLPRISSMHFLIPAEANLQAGIIYGVRIRVRDYYEPKRWQVMSLWSEIRYFEMRGKNNLVITTGKEG
jgi:hypothetical protein